MKPDHTETGEVFEIGQIWMSPRGSLYHVVGIEPGRPRQAVLRMGGIGRKVRRPWDHVAGWVIDTHADGTKAGPGVHR